MNDPISIKHIDEGIERISNDEKDQLKLRQAIETCVHPLLEIKSTMCNIYTGEIVAANMNVQSALRIREEMMSKFESFLPEIFSKICPKKPLQLERQKLSTK